MPSLVLCFQRAKSLSCVQLFATPWSVACQAPLLMGFSRHEYWSMSSSKGSYQPRDLAQVSCAPALASWFFTTSAAWEAPFSVTFFPNFILDTASEEVLPVLIAHLLHLGVEPPEPFLHTSQGQEALGGHFVLLPSVTHLFPQEYQATFTGLSFGPHILKASAGLRDHPGSELLLDSGISLGATLSAAGGRG